MYQDRTSSHMKCATIIENINLLGDSRVENEIQAVEEFWGLEVCGGSSRHSMRRSRSEPKGISWASINRN